ncbi:MAG: hypothetical protein CSA31_01330 [Desulfobulbus propionicus]|nr:MAG: hypothetical protein CSA31_01330 [Desulfobulbus propionicus]
MIKYCPFCLEYFQLTSDQQSKLDQTLAALAPGKSLTLKCPCCQQAVKLGKNGMPRLGQGEVTPPSPPNIDWLRTGYFQGEEKVEDVPMALFFLKPTQERKTIRKAIESVGYQVVLAETAYDAIDRMRFVNFACVIYQVNNEKELKKSKFHEHMCTMSMERRRYIFYVLTGPGFHTLYNLEAMAYSANLVVSSEDVGHFESILRKSIPDYEEIFGPLIEEISAYGKR